MRISLRKYLERICADAVHGARGGTEAAVNHVRDSDELTIDVNVGGVPLRSEGAANTPPALFLATKMKLATEAYLELGEKHEPMVTLKRGLHRCMPKLEIEIEFGRSQALESLELIRDRANEVNKIHKAIHAVRVRQDGVLVPPHEVEKETPDATSDE